MANDSDRLGGRLGSQNTGVMLTGFLAEEDAFDRRTLWRLGSWGAASVGAVIIALLANQSSIRWRRDQFAAADLVRQSQQIQSVAKESQSEARRLASAIETLNADRDRLYSRVSGLEQGLESVTGALSRQATAATSPQAAALPASSTESASVSQKSAPVVSPVMATSAATTPATEAKTLSAAEKPVAGAAVVLSSPATVSAVEPGMSSPPATSPSIPLMAAPSMMAPPDPAAGKLIEPEKPASSNTGSVITSNETAASVPPDGRSLDTTPAAQPEVALQRTEFALDLGGANSLSGLRALWRGLLRSNPELTPLHPIVVVREDRSGLGMQLRLAAGPITDAAAAAKLCAALVESQHVCETTLFDGQRLAINDDGPPASAKSVAPVAPAVHKRNTPKHAAKDEQAKKPDSTSTLSLIFGRR